MIDKKLGEKMKDLKITQQELAKRLGVSQSAVARMINPDSDPKLSTIRRLASALDISECDVLNSYNKKENFDC